MCKLSLRIACHTLAVITSVTLGAYPGASVAEDGPAGGHHVHRDPAVVAPKDAKPAAGHNHGPDAQAAHHHDGHAHHAQMMRQQTYTRTETEYSVPDVTLTNQDGDRVALRELLTGSKPVLLNYIFTTCTTICPVLSASFGQMRRTQGAGIENVRLVSISIDPEHDSPDRLADYAQRFHAAEGWELLTGSRDDIIEVQKAFDAFRGDKMNHVPLTFLHAPGGERWIRLEGFPSADELISEYRQAIADQRATSM